MALNQNQKVQRVLVCGGAGFLGAHIVATLLASGAEVTVLDPCVPGTGGREENLAALSERITWLRAPASDQDALNEALSDCNLVFDAMGFTRHHVGIENPLLDLELNYLSHVHLALALNRFPRRLVYLGTRSQFGAASPIDEHACQVPVDPQGVHKSAAESLLRIFSARYGWPMLSVRLDNCFGPGQLVTGEDIGLVGGFIRTLRAGKRVELFGTVDRSRNLAFAPDVALWLVEAAQRITNGFYSVNMFGQKVRLTRLLDLLVERIGQGGYDIVPFPREIALLEPNDGESSRAAFLQYVPEPKVTPLVEAIDATVTYFEAECP